MRARGRRSPSRKWFIQKLNSASSSKIRILQWGLRLRSVRTDEGESFSSSRKGNEEYRRGQSGETNGTADKWSFFGGCFIVISSSFFFAPKSLFWTELPHSTRPKPPFHGQMRAYHSIDLSSWHASLRCDKRIFSLWEGRRFSFLRGSSWARSKKKERKKE